MARKGISEAISEVILISAMLVLAAAFLVFASISFYRSAAASSISVMEAFFTNVADDIEASMYGPGTSLSYEVPSTYGSPMAIQNFCNGSIIIGDSPPITFNTGSIIYSTPPNYYSLPAGYFQVIRGSLYGGEYSRNEISLLTDDPAAPLIAITMSGESGQYGTYLAMFPRILLVKDGAILYIYVPMIKAIESSYGPRLDIYVSNVLVNQNPFISQVPVTVAEQCNSLGLKSSMTLTVDKVYIIYINMTARFG